LNFVRSIAAVLAALVAGSAAAQAVTPTPRLEVERLQLDPSARGSLVVGTGEVALRGSFRAAAAGQREHLPLVLVGPSDYLGRRSDSAATEVIGDRDTLHLVVDYVVLPRVELYGRVNFIVSQGTEGLTAGSTGFGMPSFGVRLGALQQSAGAPVNVAVAAEFLPPWGDAGLFAKPADPGGLFRVEVGRDLGRAVIGVEGSYLLRDKELIGVREMGSEIRWGAVVAGKGMLAPELSYRGAYGVDGDKGPGSGELLAGLRLRAGPVEVFGLGGPGFFNRVGTPQWRALAGLAFRFDRTPPPPPSDPCAPGQTHTPEQCPDLDDDSDGVLNKDDACPTVAGIPELKGCPAKDTDGDRVPDHLDKCPTEPGLADNQGCPRVVVKPKMVELREKVQFDTGKATLKPESNPLLDEIANVLKAHPEVTGVVIEGHTDSSGSASFNERLSQERADSVMKALVDRGVEKTRLSAKGFGPSRPIASNDTPEGRDANRRVEVSIAGRSE
jgi:OOP family OmpA-OmpF porin